MPELKLRKTGPILNAANVVTSWRIAMCPVFIAVFLSEGLWAKVAVLAIALSFELSDLLDGILARRIVGSSDFGALFDPFADSVSRFTIFLCFMHAGYASIWMVAVIFFRDMMVSYIRVWAAKSGFILAARLSGKIKAVCQGTGILAINLLAVLRETGAIGDPGDAACWTAGAPAWIMTGVACVTAASGIDYLASNAGIFRRTDGN